jgi:hypothetical protein
MPNRNVGIPCKKHSPAKAASGWTWHTSVTLLIGIRQRLARHFLSRQVRVIASLFAVCPLVDGSASGFL